MDIKETIKSAATEPSIRTMAKDMARSESSGPAVPVEQKPVPPKPVPPKPEFTPPKAVPPAELPVVESVVPKPPVPPIFPKEEIKKEIKPIIVKKSRLRFMSIALAIIIIVGGLGAFVYWWNYLRPVTPVTPVITHFECQDYQCVEIEEEGVDQCQSDQDCQPVEPIEPIVPDSLIPVDQTKVIELVIGQENLLLDKIKSVALEEQANNTFKRILIKLNSQTEKKYIDLLTIASALGLNLSDEILQAVAGNYTLFLYKQPEGNRLGIVVAMKQSDTLVQSFRDWEVNMLSIDSKPFLLEHEEAPLAYQVIPDVVEEFQDVYYQDIALRYINFPVPDLSIDYVLLPNRLAITTSQKSIQAIINVLLMTSEFE